PAPAASREAPATRKDLPASISVSKLHTDGKHYALDAKAPAIVSKGGSAELEITLLAKDGYHINDKYPYKLKPSSEPAQLATFRDAELTRKNATLTKTEARFKAPFTGAQAGEGKVCATFSLSVCTAKECVVEDVQLEVPVSVQ